MTIPKCLKFALGAVAMVAAGTVATAAARADAIGPMYFSPGIPQAMQYQGATVPYSANQFAPPNRYRGDPTVLRNLPGPQFYIRGTFKPDH